MVPVKWYQRWFAQVMDIGADRLDGSAA